MELRCPICHGPVTGGRAAGYYCESCNLIFPSHAFRANPQQRKRLLERHFGDTQ